MMGQWDLVYSHICSWQQYKQKGLRVHHHHYHVDQVETDEVGRVAKLGCELVLYSFFFVFEKHSGRKKRTIGKTYQSYLSNSSGLDVLLHKYRI